MKKKIYYSTLTALLLIISMILILSSAEPEENHRVIKKSPKKIIEISIDIIKETKKKPAALKKTTSPKKVQQKSVVKSKPIKASEKNYCGELPPISANYRKHLGFNKYAEEMTKRDALFFIHDANENKLYKINFSDSSIVETDIKSIELNKYSSKSRIITDEPALNNILNNAKNKYDLISPEVILLVPKYLERILLDALNKSSMPLNKISHFKAYYTNNKGGLTLSIHTAVISGKTEILTPI